MNYALPAMLSGILLLATSDSALACSCKMHSTCDGVAHADAVFEATVSAIEDDPQPERLGGARIVTLRDVRPWIGEPSTTVMTLKQSTMCGYDFKIGVRYIIVAWRGADGTLSTSRCSQTQIAGEPSELREYLDNLASQGGGMVMGAISAKYSPFAPSLGTPEPPIEGARVTLNGPALKATTTATDGRFRFMNVPPGTYTVIAELPADRRDLEPIATASVIVSPPLACGSAAMEVPYGGSFVGKIVNESGEPVPVVQVSIRRRDSEAPYRSVQTTRSDIEGQFSFAELPPGTYEIGINLPRGPREWNPFETVPEHDRSTIRIVTLEPGGRARLSPIVVRRLQ